MISVFDTRHLPGYDRTRCIKRPNGDLAGRWCPPCARFWPGHAAMYVDRRVVLDVLIRVVGIGRRITGRFPSKVLRRTMVHPGNVRRPFVDLVKLEKIDGTTYRSTAPPFSPGDELGPGRAYGGHIYAQAAWAASQTVESAFVIHSVTGNFILAGLLNVPFIYQVHIIHDGRSYCTRVVNVTQPPSDGVRFTCTVVFKTAETSLLDVQAPVDLWTKYASVLSGKRPTDFPLGPGMDTPSYVQRRAMTGLNDALPGLDMPKVDMRDYNAMRHPLERRQLTFYRTIGPLPSPPSSPNLHLCAHLYASDRNSLFHVVNLFDVADRWTAMGSLSLHVVFHAPLAALLFRASTPPQDAGWFVKEDSSDRISGGTGLCHSKLYAPDGTHVATCLQDGLMRFTRQPQATTAERDEIQARVQAYPPRQEKL
nr:acyl-coenzyme a thioesterase 8 [Quercus suber]